ncbi:hypothetical protein AXF41_00035 [Clostridium haemolyticum]|uniref:hypothetical protein n=1 Tax=Clostridium haemolyticum TaxID=84025 RepID=UPI0009CBCE4D|nr:hypothetical protein [Clostridium haemolyticum]OOB76753.1 hypothetical protein AXF41_00035 [Clostridium haemolyticum]
MEYSVDGGSKWNDAKATATEIEAPEVGTKILVRTKATNDTLPGVAKELTVALDNISAAVAPKVTNDDIKNTVNGIDGTMEFSTDGISWTTYNATTPNLPDLTKKVDLKVRVKATDKKPASKIKILNFTE